MNPLTALDCYDRILGKKFALRDVTETEMIMLGSVGFEIDLPNALDFHSFIWSFI